MIKDVLIKDMKIGYKVKPGNVVRGVLAGDAETAILWENGGIGTYDSDDKFLGVDTSGRIPQMGDRIYVRDTNNEKWSSEQRIVVKNGKNGVICLNGAHEKEYMAGDPFDTTYWHQFKFADEEPEGEPNIKITVKVNGKECKLSDISEETLKRIREAN